MASIGGWGGGGGGKILQTTGRGYAPVSAS